MGAQRETPEDAKMLVQHHPGSSGTTHPWEKGHLPRMLDDFYFILFMYLFILFLSLYQASW